MDISLHENTVASIAANAFGDDSIPDWNGQTIFY